MDSEYSPPPVRRLRVYAFDPQTTTELASAGYAAATIALPWEEKWEEPVGIGPVNEYLEVVDVDPASGQFYAPLDLNHPHLLAQDGLAPSEGNPQFHQQMVFAVAMKVIKLFERALGRKVIWRSKRPPDGRGGYVAVKKLRIYPHALREANAYYSPDKWALLFGYFRSANPKAGANWIFTALSHDIIAHETTHAVLDGVHRRYAEATSVDSLAFHEAFADIVALFSHFTLTEAVQAHIQDKGGDLDRKSLLSGLAGQFAAGTTGRESLRQYVGTPPDPELLAQTTECHERGAILVAAVFDAFLAIYKARTDDLMRIGGVDRGTGKRLNAELVARLTREATKTADQVLRMCIRALDYLPPVDVRFHEFLRAIITADHDLVPNDPLNYRVAFAEAFRRRGILAPDCLSMSPENLLWDSPEHLLGSNPLKIGGLTTEAGLDLMPHYQRDHIITSAEENRLKIWQWLIQPDARRSKQGDARKKEWGEALGLHLIENAGMPQSIGVGKFGPKIEIHSVRTTRRTGPDGQDVRQLVIEVAQKRRGYLDPKQQKLVDTGKLTPAPLPDFVFRGGATLIVDLRESEPRLRYVIRKRIESESRLQEQRDLLSTPAGFGFTYLPKAGGPDAKEPFAMMHRGL